MVFVRRHFSEGSAASEGSGPLVVTIAIVAMIGWALVAYLCLDNFQMRARFDGRTAAADGALQNCGPEP